MPVPGFYRERITIAILCGETMDLHWRDEHSDLSYMARVLPRELMEENGMDYLLGENAEGEAVKIRLDLIRNMPRPVK